MEEPEIGRRVANLVEAFDAQRGYQSAAVPEGRQGGGAVPARGEVAGVGILHTGHEINLLEGG